MSTQPVAVVGFGCRLPGGVVDGPSYWRLLAGGVDAVREVPPDRWSVEAFATDRSGVPGKSASRWGGFLEQVDRFEPEAFGISPREAAYVDPQQRLLLECAWEALESAGMPLERMVGSRTGVFIGLSTADYAQLQRSPHELRGLSAFTAHGTSVSTASNRLSYCLDLRGPSFTVDTACSSALVAVDRAVRSLTHGESEMALAGGANVILTPEPFVSFSQAAMLSPDGRCKAFDASADGFVRAEGAGVVVLKRLADAERDGDPIHAVILETGVNQDGRTGGLSMPNPDSQARLIREVHARAGIRPEEVAYVEAHGTGTAVGDPAETRALGEVFAPGRDETRPLVIGSVKSNLGHLEAASGIASLLKVVLMLRRRRVPPSLHFRTPNPEIRFDQWKLRVPTELEPWPDELPATVGINSFGFGGTNAHAVVREYGGAGSGAVGGAGLRSVAGNGAEEESGGRRPPGGANAPPAVPLVLSARSPEALAELAARWADVLADDEGGRSGASRGSLAELAGSAALRRTRYPHRLGLAATDRADAREQLEAFVAGRAGSGVHPGRVSAGSTPRVAFVFSGQGPQWHAMGRELLAREPVFADAFRACDERLRTHLGWSVADEITADEAASRMELTSVAQPALFALQVALAELWASRGVRPDVVVGHSVGEIAAARVAGILSLADAARLVAHRGLCLQAHARPGRMLAVALTEEEVRDHLVADTCIAAVNAPRMVTVAGSAGAVTRLAERLDGAGVWCRELRVRHAFHSPLVEPAEVPFLKGVGDLAVAPPRTAMISTVTGEPLEGAPGAEYWWRNVRSAVRLAPALRHLAERGVRAVVEVGPHPVLSSSIRQVDDAIFVVPSLVRATDETRTMAASAAGLWTRGVPVDWTAWWSRPPTGVDLPSHPWRRKRYWHEGDVSRRERLPVAPHPLLGSETTGAHRSWRGVLDRRERGWIVDHRVDGQVVFPAAGFLELLIAAAERVLGDSAVIIDDVRILRGLFLPAEQVPRIETVVDPAGDTLTISSRVGGDEGAWVEHCRASFRAADSAAAPAPGTGDAPADGCRTAPENGSGVDPGRSTVHRVDREAFYADLERVGLDYGRSFRAVRHVDRTDEGVWATVELPAAVDDGDRAWGVHPALLDGCLQAIQVALPESLREKEILYLPAGLERLRRWRPAGSRVVTRVRLVEASELRVTGDLFIRTADGEPVMELTGFTCRAVPSTPDSDALADASFDVRWVHRPTPEGETVAHPLRLNVPLQALVEAAAPTGSATGHATEGCEVPRRPTAATPDDEPGPWDATDELALHHIADALRTASRRAGPRVRPDPGARHDPEPRVDLDEMERSGALNGEWRPTLERWLGRLEAAGCADPDGEAAWRLGPSPEAAPYEATWRRALRRHPGSYPLLRLTELCGRRLPEVWAGRIEPGEVVADPEVVAQRADLERSAPGARARRAFLRRFVADLVEAVPPHRPFRVIELGAGTGATAEALLPLLPEGRSEYWLVASSEEEREAARKLLGDPEALRLAELGTEPTGVFDMVISSAEPHRELGAARVAERARELLVEGGVLVVDRPADLPLGLDLVRLFARGGALAPGREDRPRHEGEEPPCHVAETRASFPPDHGFETPVTIRPDRARRDEVLVVRRRRGSGAASPGPTEPSAPPGCDGRTVSSTGRTAPPPTSEPGRRWLVLAPESESEMAERLVRRLPGGVALRVGPTFLPRSDRGFILDPRDPDHLERLRSELGPPAKPGDGLIFIVASGDSGSGDGEPDAAMADCRALLRILQAWALSSIPDIRELVLVTRGVEVVGDPGEPGRSPAAAVKGFGRVAATEFPALRVRMVDLDPAGGGRDELLAELTTEDGQEETAWREGHRFVPRVVPVRPARPSPHPTTDHGAPPRDAFEIVVRKTGDLGSVEARAVQERAPGPGEVRVDVRYAALNFRDVLKALGKYPVDDPRLLAPGDECAGRIRDVGPGVEGVAPGDRVVLSGIGLLRSEVTLPVDRVRRVPDGLSLASAAALPVAYVTADYALREVARLQGGESVLIHSAAGGVGLAALGIARSLGAKVFATAGTPAKRELLLRLGAAHVMDSRSLTFADELREATGGRGVDVILNSLAGRAMERSLASLAPRGRFVELGRRDFFENTRVGLAPLQENGSYHAVDLAALVDRPAEFADRVARLTEACASGELDPLPVRVTPASLLTRELRRMSRGGHVGKIVVDVTEPGPVRRPAPSLELRADRSYLVTGGFGGLGRGLARRLVERGARHLVLVGRSGARDPDAQATLAELRSGGVEVRSAAVDVSDGAALADLLADLHATMLPLAGVFHLAMVLQDATIADTTPEGLHAVFRPKVHGAWNLHRLTLERPLDHFVLFGSSAARFGNFGQSSYAAGNAALEALAAHRRAAGLPATAVAWGLIGEVGVAAERPGIADSLEGIGVLPLSPTDVWDALEAAVGAAPATRIVQRANWGRLGSSLRASRRLPGLFDPLLDRASEDPDDEADRAARALLEARNSSEREELAVEYVRSRVAGVLGASPRKLDADLPLSEMGLDSLMGVELVDRISTELGVSLPLTTMSRDVDIRTMASRLVRLVFGGETPAAGGEGAAPLEGSPRVIRLAGEAEAPRVCCLHPAGGDLGVYEELAGALGGWSRVSGVQSRLLAGADREFASVEAMGEAYAELLVRSGPPAGVVGFSMGGLVALETVLALERRDASPAFVALIEFDPAPAAEPETSGAVAEFLAVLLEHFERRAFVVRGGAMARLTNQVAEVADAVVSSGGDGVSIILRWLEDNGALRADTPRDLVERYLHAVAEHLRLFAAPRRSYDLAVPTYVWLADEGLFRGAAARAASGNGRRPAAATVLRADHYSIMAAPRVERIAERIRVIASGREPFPDGR